MIARYQTFSSFKHACGVDARLAARYVPKFDALVAFVRTGSTVFPMQRDVSGKWQESLDSVVAATEWCWLSDGCTVVTVLLDDDEFGRDVKWYFSPGFNGILDVKDAIVLVEQGMEIVTAIAMDPVLALALHHDARDDHRFDPGAVARSDLFCYSIPAQVCIPPGLSSIIQTNPSTLPATGVFHVPSRPGTVFTWQVLEAVSASLVLDGAPGEMDLTVRSPPPLFDVLQLHILAIATVQLRLVAKMIRSEGGLLE